MNWASLSHLCGLTGPWWAPPRLVLSEGGQIKNNRIHLSIQQLTHPHKHPNEKSRRSETYRWPPPSLSLFENLLARGPHVSTASLTKQAREERGTNHHIGAQQQCSCQSPSTKLRQRTVELSQLTVPPPNNNWKQKNICLKNIVIWNKNTTTQAVLIIDVKQCVF